MTKYLNLLYKYFLGCGADDLRISTFLYDDGIRKGLSWANKLLMVCMKGTYALLYSGTSRKRQYSNPGSSLTSGLS